jgi:SAM-dependent methyltransferase
VPRATAPDRDVVSIDSTVAHTSRVYDYLLGGSTNFAVDRAVADDAFASYPGGVDGARADARRNRAFLGRAVRHLARDVGLRQFLDIGPGIPDSGSTHTIARAVATDVRVVYVDNDPIVLAHAHDLLAGSPEGATRFVQGDVRRPDAVLEQAADTLDLTRPVALLLLGVLHVVPDADNPQASVARLVDALAPGSHVVISHMTDDGLDGADGADLVAVTTRLADAMRSTNPPAIRDRASVAAFLDGLDLIEPGLVPVGRWRPDGEADGASDTSPVVGGVARKP